jgi:hypothetical protein
MDESKLPPHWPILVVSILLGSLCVAIWQRSGGSKRPPLPPRPRGSLLLGNLLEVTKASKESLQHLLMHTWAREHGEIFRVRLGPVTNYFLNSDRAVKVP